MSTDRKKSVPIALADSHTSGMKRQPPTATTLPNLVDIDTLGSVTLGANVNGVNYDFCEIPPGSIAGGGAGAYITAGGAAS